MAGWGRKARAVAAILRGDAPHSPPVAATAPEPAPAPAPAPCEPVAAVPARETLMGAQLRIVAFKIPIRGLSACRRPGTRLGVQVWRDAGVHGVSGRSACVSVVRAHLSANRFGQLACLDD